MNGKTYIRSFANMPTTVSDSLEGTQAESLTRFVDESATSMLHNLYGVGEADFLNEPTPTSTLDIATDFLDVRRGIRTLLSEKRSQFIRERNNGNQYGNLSFRKPTDKTEEVDDNALKVAVTTGQDADKALLRFHAVGMLSEAVTLCHRFGESRPAADSVKQAIGNTRAVLLGDIAKAIFAIDQTVDEAGRVQDIDISTVNATFRAPNWIRNLTVGEKSEAVKLLAARGILEYDAYFAMLHWVVDRSLPLMPIPVPPALERTAPGKDQKNPNADFLLCSVETNEVVPVQVKNTFTVEGGNAYVDWMQFMTPSNLGIVEMLGAQPVRNEWGKVGTKPLSVVHYGSLALAYFNKDDKKKGVNNPFTTASKALDLRLQASRS